MRSSFSESGLSPATTTRTWLPSPGTAKVLTIFTGLSSALVSRLRSSRCGSLAPVNVNTAPRGSGRSTDQATSPVSLSSTTPPLDDSVKVTSWTSPVGRRSLEGWCGSARGADRALPSSRRFPPRRHATRHSEALATAGFGPAPPTAQTRPVAVQETECAGMRPVDIQHEPHFVGVSPSTKRR